jgi:hypothetical protein
MDPRTCRPTRRGVLRAAGAVLGLALATSACAADCSAPLTPAHLERLRSYARFIGFIQALVGNTARGDYLATLARLAAAIGNPTLQRLADDLVAVLKDDALGDVKAHLPLLARGAVDLALKAVDDPTVFLRDKVIDLIKTRTFVGELDAHATAIIDLPGALDGARGARDARAIAGAADHGTAALAYFRRLLEGLRDVGATRIPLLDITLVDAIGHCAGRPDGEVAATLDAALRDLADVEAALALTARQCAA